MASVSRWNVDIGDPVRKGQVLATIDTPDLDAQLAAARAKLKADQALLKVRQAEADFAQSTYARWKDSPKGVVSEQEREAKKSGLRKRRRPIERGPGADRTGSGRCRPLSGIDCLQAGDLAL